MATGFVNFKCMHNKTFSSTSTSYFGSYNNNNLCKQYTPVLKYRLNLVDMVEIFLTCVASLRPMVAIV